MLILCITIQDGVPSMDDAIVSKNSWMLLLNQAVKNKNYP